MVGSINYAVIILEKVLNLFLNPKNSVDSVIVNQSKLLAEERLCFTHTMPSVCKAPEVRYIT